MYKKNTISKRRPSGWVERRRYFQRLFAGLPVTVPKGEEKRTGVPVGDRD